MAVLKGSCHCGSIKFVLNVVPDWLTSCNCSYCRRSGAVWAHATPSDISVDYQQSDVVRYAHGDKSLTFVSCKICGCTTHWEPLKEQTHPRMALNMNMVRSDDIKDIRVRLFDGAESWTYFD